VIESLIAAGRVVALPVVIDRHCPLEYRTWRPGEKLVSGVWDIPIPEKREIVIPATVLAPLVGFDRTSYRLGYGGGYFDRTLAALRPRPFAIGVGFGFQQLETIYPQPFDIPSSRLVASVIALATAAIGGTIGTSPTPVARVRHLDEVPITKGDGSQVCSGLPAGGSRIRTLGPRLG
jgi:5-formyltetrahydrofolate cyclo-ligase family